MTLEKANDIIYEFYQDFPANADNSELSFMYVEAMEYIIKQKNDPDYILGLGSYYYVKKDYEKAIDLYEQAADMQFEPAYECLGYVWFAKNQKLREERKNRSESFGERFFRLVDEKGLTDAAVYKKARVDRRLISKLRMNPDKRISKETAMALSIALELPIAEVDDLLRLAGFAMSPRYKFDRMVRFFIENGNYNIDEINEALYRQTKHVLSGRTDG